jgi:hypothetical protein
MPKFGRTCRAGRESLPLEPFSNWQTGQLDVGMWVDIVSTSTRLVRSWPGARFLSFDCPSFPVLPTSGEGRVPQGGDEERCTASKRFALGAVQHLACCADAARLAQRTLKSLCRASRTISCRQERPFGLSVMTASGNRTSWPLCVPSPSVKPPRLSPSFVCNAVDNLLTCGVTI